LAKKESEAMANWETDKSGNIVLFPVLGFDTAIAAQSAALLKIQFARSEEQMRAGGEAIQLVLSPLIAREIALSLLQMAERLECPPPAGTTKN
jgi:hypothetical protein